MASARRICGNQRLTIVAISASLFPLYSASSGPSSCCPQDPTDEPASVLLDRIRQERTAAAAAPAAKKPRKAAK